MPIRRATAPAEGRRPGSAARRPPTRGRRLLRRRRRRGRRRRLAEPQTDGSAQLRIPSPQARRSRDSVGDSHGRGRDGAGSDGLTGPRLERRSPGCDRGAQQEGIGQNPTDEVHVTGQGEAARTEAGRREPRRRPAGRRAGQTGGEAHRAHEGEDRHRMTGRQAGPEHSLLRPEGHALTLGAPRLRPFPLSTGEGPGRRDRCANQTCGTVRAHVSRRIIRRQAGLMRWRYPSSRRRPGHVRIRPPGSESRQSRAAARMVRISGSREVRRRTWAATVWRRMDDRPTQVRPARRRRLRES